MPNKINRLHLCDEAMTLHVAWTRRPQAFHKKKCDETKCLTSALLHCVALVGSCRVETRTPRSSFTPLLTDDALAKTSPL